MVLRKTLENIRHSDLSYFNLQKDCELTIDLIRRKLKYYRCGIYYNDSDRCFYTNLAGNYKYLIKYYKGTYLAT